jgi:cell division protein FtsI/penicillin-binding protein 2
MYSTTIPQKANRVLHVITLGFLLILIRVWYLAVIEHETYLELSKKPQKKTVIEKPLRGTIRDRFNIPLAVNKIQYDIGVCYDTIRQIPSVKRISLPNGSIEKIFPRKEYIQKLTSILTENLQLDPQDLEDLLYGKACLFPQRTFTLKENISETCFYKFKALERLYPGLIALRKTQRYYPEKKTAGDLVGYLGSMNFLEVESIHSELEELDHYLKEHEQGNLVFLPKGFSSMYDVKNRIKQLKKDIFQVEDKIGKTGIEAKFENILKGDYGKKTYEVNTKGSIVREIPGSKPAESGKRLLLNISSELQHFAEALLAENEAIRDQKFTQLGKNHSYISSPWIKGGAIVAMIPTTGEVVALASYPRVDPNDFISQATSKYSLHRWLEDKDHIASIWDGKIPLEREFYSRRAQSFYKEEKKLSLETFLERILSCYGHAKKNILRISTLEQSIEIQKAALTLLDLSEQPNMPVLIDALYAKQEKHIPSCFSSSEDLLDAIQESLSHHAPYVNELKSILDKNFSNLIHNDDKLLVLDILKLVSPCENFSSSLLESVGIDLLSSYRKLCQSLAQITEEIHEMSKETFHQVTFRSWRAHHFKAFLAKKRLEEKENKSYQKPYIDYLKQEETLQFKQFWQHHKWDLIEVFIYPNSPTASSFLPYLERFSKFKQQKASISHPSLHVLSSIDYLESRLKNISVDLGMQYLKTMRSFNDLDKRLYGFYSQIKKRKGFQTEKDLAASFYPPQGYGYGRSFGFRQSTALGSIFKIITAYEAIRQNFSKGSYISKKDLNPLTIIDEIQPAQKDMQLVLGFHEDGRKITRNYKGGTLPRSHTSLGKIDYVKAFERSSNIYFSLLASDIIQDPNDLSMASLKFGFGNKTGIDLPGEISGALPKDLHENRSGLYAFAIGQHSLIVTPLQTAVMLSSLVNGGEILKPHILQLSAGTQSHDAVFSFEEQYPYKDYLNKVGIFFPFFLQMRHTQKQSDIRLFEKTLYRKLFLPDSIKDYLLQGMHSVVSSPRGSARAELIRYLYQNTQAMHNYLKLKYQLAGKTSSAEFAYHPTLDRECPKILCKDIWFGGVAFKQDLEESPSIKKREQTPELVVVVYLKFGDFGKEAAPLAAEVITKWREICSREGKTSFITY